MKTKKLIIIILIVAVIAFAGYKLWKKFEEYSGRLDGSDPHAVPATNPVATNTRNDNFPLKKGSKGDRVKVVQRWCNWAKDCELTVDGDFGSKTEAAVQKCVSVDGVYVNYVPESAYNQMNTLLAKYETRDDYLATLSPKETINQLFGPTIGM